MKIQFLLSLALLGLAQNFVSASLYGMGVVYATKGVCSDNQAAVLDEVAAVAAASTGFSRAVNSGRWKHKNIDKDRRLEEEEEEEEEDERQLLACGDGWHTLCRTSWGAANQSFCSWYEENCRRMLRREMDKLTVKEHRELEVSMADEVIALLEEADPIKCLATPYSVVVNIAEL